MQKELKNGLVGKSVKDVANVEVQVAFNDGSGFYMPLTKLQAAYLFYLLNVTIDGEKGIVNHLTDAEILEIMEKKKQNENG